MDTICEIILFFKLYTVSTEGITMLLKLLFLSMPKYLLCNVKECSVSCKMSEFSC